MSKKILAFVLALVLVCSLIPAVAAAETSATISFEDKANRTAYSTASQVWQQNGITVTNNKDASTSNVGDYANPGRFYKSSTLIIAYPGMTKIEIDCSTKSLDAKYITAWEQTLDAAGIAYTNTDKIITVTLAEATNSLTLVMANQGRAFSMTVYGGGTVTPTEPTEPEATEPEATEPAGDVLTNPVEIVNAAYALAPGAKMDYPVTLTGEITKVKTAFSSQYNNVTVVMVVEGCEDKPITCFRLAGAGADQIAVGDTITVTGTIVNYQHSSGDTEVEFEQGCTLDSWVAGGSQPTEPEVTEPTTPAPEAGSVLTIPEANALGAGQATGAYTTEKYKVSGTILEIDNTTYGNMTITDGTNTLYIYGTYNADGSARYDAMDVKPVVGDEITVLGIIGNYSNNPQMKNGWIVEHTPGVPEVTDPVEEPDAEISFADVANRVSQTAEQQVWQQNGITVTNDKAESSNDIIDSSNPVRFYKNSVVTIEAAGMTKIVIKCNNLTYANQLMASFSADVNATQDVSEVTIVFAEPVDSFTVTLSGGQVRVNSIGVYFVDESGDEGLAGDIDGNGTVSNDDVIALMWNVLFPEQYPLEGNVDMNKDGSVDNNDVIALMWYVLFPEQYPLPL